MVRYIFLIALSISCISLTHTPCHAQSKLKKIVIDAGHGGKDPGAHGQYSKEKDLTLAVALKLGQILKDSMPNLQVIFTRTTDIYPDLKTRHEIANKANADLFLSIHINATAPRTERVFAGYKYTGKGKHRRKIKTYKTIYHRETSTSGTESYVLGLHRTGQKEEAIENYSDNVTEEGGVLNENDPTTAIIITQYSQRFLSRSVTFANKIQSAFERMGRANFGVKQKGLEVLAGSAMPGVLTELGFINNPDEENFMNSPAGQQQYAMALYQAIKAYNIEISK